MEQYELFVTTLVFLLFGGVALFCLASSLRKTVNQLTRMNEQLLIMVGVKQGGEPVGRALVAHTREKGRSLPGIATPAKEKPAGYVEVVGAH